MAGRQIVFGSHVFDPTSGSLHRGRERRRLQSQPAQLLALLVEREGEVVTREQIRQTLWPDTTVAYDQNINFAIRQIRIALEVDADLVQTVPRHGYRFVGEVRRGQSGRRRLSWKGLAVAAAFLLAAASGFGAGVVVRDQPAGRFVYAHLVHPDRCPYLRMFFEGRRNS